MNKIYQFVVFVLLNCSCYAQTLVPKAGFTVSANTIKSSTSDMKPGAGFLLGAGYSYPLYKNLSLQPEVYFLQKAFQLSDSSRVAQTVGGDNYAVSYNAKDKFRLSYLELPVLLKLKLLNSNFFGVLGPVVSMGVGGVHHYQSSIKSSYFGDSYAEGSGKIKFGNAEKGSIKDEYLNKWDFGFQAGLGVMLFSKLQFEFRYSSGSVNLVKNQNTKNKSIQFTLSIPLDFGKQSL